MNTMNAELSLGPFCNWFLPSCSHVWSSDDGDILFAYGARSSVCLCECERDDYKLRLHDCIEVFAHKNIVSVVRFAPHPRTAHLFIGSNDGDAVVFDCHTKQWLRQETSHSDPMNTSKKILSADWENDETVYYSIHSLIIKWNIRDGSLQRVMIGQNYVDRIGISVLACSHSHTKELAVGYMNGDLIIVNFDNLSNNNVTQKEYYLIGHKDDVCSLSYSWSNNHYDAGILASVSRDGFVKVWDVYKQICIADVKLDANKQKHKNWFSLAILPTASPGSKFEILVGCGNGQIVRFEIPAQPPASKIRVYKPQAFDSSKTCTYSHSSVIFNIAIDARNMIATTTSLDHQIIVWDLRQRKAVDAFYTFSHGANDISCCTIDPSSFAIAIGDGLQIIKLSNKNGTQCQRRIPFYIKSKNKVNAVCWHPEKENRIGIGSSGGEVSVIDIYSSQSMNTKYSTKAGSYDSSRIYCLVWGPALGTTNEWALYCVHQSGELFVHFTAINKFNNFNDYVCDQKKRTEVSWKSDYSNVAVGNEDGSIDVFEYCNNELTLKIVIKAYSKAILCLRWNSNFDEESCNWLASASYDKHILIYSLCKEIELSLQESCPIFLNKSNWTLTGHEDRITSMSWCPFDFNKLASVSYDKTVRIWQVKEQIELCVYKGHRSFLYCVAWSLFDSDLLMSGGEDNIVHVWRPSKQLNNLLSLKCNKSTEGDFEWPHLKNNEQTSIYQVIDECIHKVEQMNDSPNTCNNHDVQHNDNQIKCEATQMTSSSDKILKSKLKNSGPKITKKSNRERRNLFPLLNSIDSNSSKLQRVEDIECLTEKMLGNQISAEKNERLLLFGDYNDIKRLLQKEMEHHENHNNKHQRQIIGLYQDIKSVVNEAIQKNELNAHLVSLSMSVSRQLWKDACKAYAKQLENSGDFEMAANYLLSLSCTTEAIDLFVKNGLYKEALVLAKLKCESNEVISEIMIRWAHDKKMMGDVEGAAACLTSCGMFNEAADMLSSKCDQQYINVSSLLRSKIQDLKNTQS